ncbi:MAG: hypothetical protein ACI4FZ_02970 [Lachnospiraceae bacterium]
MSIFEKDMLKGGEKELQKLKESVRQLDDCEKALKELEHTEKEEQKQLEKRKKEIDNEVEEKEAEKRKKVAEPFDNVILELEKNKKEKVTEKEKKRKEEIKARCENETGGLRERGNNLKAQIKKIAEEDGIPGVCISKLFLAFYYPKHVSDFFVLFLSLAVIFLLIPLGCFKLLFTTGTIQQLTILYLITIVAFFVIYLLLNNLVKEKHINAFQSINEVRSERHKTEQEIKEIIQKIEKSTDEELGLDEYNNAIAELEASISEKKLEKENALNSFDDDAESKEKRENEIRGTHEDELRSMSKKLEETTRLRTEKLNELSEREKGLHNTYQPLLSIEKNIFKEKVIDELLGYIQTGEVKTIEEAIEKRKNPKAAVEEK